MKTKNNGRNAFIQALMLLVLVFSVACGENNTSGKKKNRNNFNNPWGNTFGGGTYIGGNGQVLNDNWLDQIALENQCALGGQRATAQMQVPANVNVGALYVGVTSFGDIGVVQNQNGVGILTLYICPRAGLTGQGSIMSQVVIENSVYCPVGQISNLDIQLQGQATQYALALRPIHIPNMGITSSICTNGMYY